ARATRQSEQRYLVCGFIGTQASLGHGSTSRSRASKVPFASHDGRRQRTDWSDRSHGMEPDRGTHRERGRFGALARPLDPLPALGGCALAARRRARVLGGAPPTTGAFSRFRADALGNRVVIEGQRVL